MRKKLIVMLKYPEPGAVKTRLVPALGERRACELYLGLVRQTLAVVDSFVADSGAALEIRLTGGPGDAAAPEWLGEQRCIRPQGGGDLGERMERALRESFGHTDAAVVIGADCPELTAEHLAKAFSALTHADLVLGPAVDGGYYLIGMRRLQPALFFGIPWGGHRVLEQTLAAARALALDVAQLAMLSDVDVPEDLALWAQTPVARAAGRGGVSVIIPALDEEQLLPATLAAVLRGKPHEVIVVDGGSSDRTTGIAREHDAILLRAPMGRARQMNSGAAVATGEYLLFLHADTILPTGYPALVSSTLARPGVAGGAFEFALAGEFAGRRLIERGTNWRARHRQMPYGDQGIFVCRETFFQVGGFPDLPIMEDCEFIHRLRRHGTIAIAPGAALASGRRWQRLGPWRTTLVNQLVVLGYFAGIAPARLAHWYHRPRQLRAARSALPGNNAAASPLSTLG